ncbi:26S proteasome non-ATPase regulatory subunit 1-like [Rhagoletis pomonella]|uniref:26S proteasome non-ATPase regulatory subunit 1-like n=1 Tax=Rhagoletis pomonella TaxID=28610 RepID=UPI00177C7CA4|nr:26S proteasome non-ATPase regulatory subunit 1-like [Rhagoletis pomonella]
MLVFTQYWYWFPLAHSLSLAFTPTCVIGLNSDLKMPKMEFKSAAKPSLYAYPAPLEEKKSEEREKVATAVLSIAARQKRREIADKKEEDNKMDVDEDSKDSKKDDKKMDVDEKVEKKEDKKKKEEKEKKKDDDKEKEKDKEAGEKKKDEKEKDKEKEKEKEKEKKDKKEPEPNFEILQNPARVVRQQLKVISVAEAQAFIPLKDVTIGGIIVLQHTGKSAEQELVEPVAAYGPKNDEAKEPEPPEPFEYIED